MTTLFLAWQNNPHAADARQRAWYPIGRLERHGSGYRFAYTKGVERATTASNFRPLLAFPDIGREYRSETLFPLFQNRVINDKRDDLADHLARLGLNPDDRDPMKILAISGGERQTDHLEVFPKIEVDQNGGFSCRFFAHGVRHLEDVHQERIRRLRDGEKLRVTVEMDNPVTGNAIQLQTEDYLMAGWAPRYLIADLLQAIACHPLLTATLIRVNAVPAPPNQRLLIELSGRLPEGCEPMSGIDFQPISGASSA